MNTAVAIVGLSLSLLTSIIAITAVVVQMKTNVSHLQSQREKDVEREDKAARELSELFGLLKAFIAEQTVINKTVQSALDSAICKLEDMEKRTVESATVVSLLTEVLKKAPARLSIEP